MQKLQKAATLNKLSGPVTSNLDEVLQDHNIKVQAFHSRSFTGNHCHQYLQDATFTALTYSVIETTTSLTSNAETIKYAKETAAKFDALNLKYNKVHTNGRWIDISIEILIRLPNSSPSGMIISPAMQAFIIVRMTMKVTSMTIMMMIVDRKIDS